VPHDHYDFPPPAIPTLLPRAFDRRRLATPGANILVPTELSDCEAPAIARGWELAAARQARWTFLSVMSAPPPLPPEELPADSIHWLEGIERVYAALNPLPQHRAALFQTMQMQLQTAREQLSGFCERQIPARIREQVDIQLEVRAGDFACEVRTFLAAQEVDLLILTSKPSWWRLPLVPSKTHRLLQEVRTRFLVVSPDTSCKPGTRPGSPRVIHDHPSAPVQTC
jgi:hypothetical protein